MIKSVCIVLCICASVFSAAPSPATLVVPSVSRTTDSLSAPVAAANDIGAFDIRKVQSELDATPGSGVPDTMGRTGQPQRLFSNTGSIAGLLIRLILSLLFVGAAITAVVWLLKKSGWGKTGRAHSGQTDLIEQLPLGQNRSIMLVRVADKVYVVGQTPTSITPIDIIEGQKAVDIISSKEAVPLKQFKDIIGTFIGKPKKEA